MPKQRKTTSWLEQASKAALVQSEMDLHIHKIIEEENLAIEVIAVHDSRMVKGDTKDLKKLVDLLYSRLPNNGLVEAFRESIKKEF